MLETLQRLFDYDPSAPLDVSFVGRESRAGVEIDEIRYANGTGGEAEAFVVGRDDPTAGTSPGVVYAHGGTAGGKHLFVDEAVELCRRGLVVLLADTSFPPLGDARATEQAFRAAVLAQRRGLDVLGSAYACDGLGFFGHSSGGMQGAILSAVERRLAAVVVAATGAGFADGIRRLGYSDPAFLAAIDRFDPVHYVGASGDRVLLVQHGRDDHLVSTAAARTMFDAAAEPKRWAEYDCGHAVSAHAPAQGDRFAFFGEILGGGA